MTEKKLSPKAQTLAAFLHLHTPAILHRCEELAEELFPLELEPTPQKPPVPEPDLSRRLTKAMKAVARLKEENARLIVEVATEKDRLLNLHRLAIHLAFYVQKNFRPGQDRDYLVAAEAIQAVEVEP